MNEFIYEYSSIITKLLELIATVTGIVLFSKYKQTTTRYFIYFLCYVFILEVLGSYTIYAYKYDFFSGLKAFIKNTWLARNYWFYCIFWTIGSALFYTFYFSEVIQNKIFKLLIKSITCIFIIYSLFAIINNWNDFFITSIKGIDLLSTIAITFSILLYLIEVLKGEKILTFHKTIRVYIALSVLIWTVIITPLSFFSKYFNVQDWDFVYLRTNIILFANVFLYTTFTIGLIVSEPEDN